MRIEGRITRREIFKKYFTFIKSADYKRYDNIVKIYYTLLLDCIEMGYTFNCVYGHLKLSKVERPEHKKLINWWESMKYKKELEAQGKLPYKEYINHEQEKVNNGGIKWYIYYPSSEPYIMWDFYAKGDYIYKYNALIKRKRNRKEKRLQFLKINKYAYPIKSEYFKQYIKDFQI